MTRLQAYAAGLVSLLALAVVGVLYLDGRDRAAEQRGYERAQAQYDKRLIEALAHAKKKERRRLVALEGAVKDARKEKDSAVAAAGDAAAVGERLRAQLAALTRNCTGHPGAAAGGPSAEATAGVLAELQRRADETAQRVARYADEARIAGAACERSYDALTK